MDLSTSRKSYLERVFGEESKEGQNLRGDRSRARSGEKGSSAQIKVEIRGKLGERTGQCRSQATEPCTWRTRWRSRYQGGGLLLY